MVHMVSPRSTRSIAGVIVGFVLLVTACGPGSVGTDELRSLARDPDAAMAALVSDSNEQLLVGDGDEDLTEAVVIAAFEAARTDPDMTFPDFLEVIDRSADVLDGANAPNPGAARGLAEVTTWHLAPLSAYVTPGGGLQRTVDVSRVAAVLTSIARDADAAAALARGLGVLQVVDIAEITVYLDDRPDAVVWPGGDQGGYIGGLFELAMGTAGGGSRGDVPWDDLVAGADAAINLAVTDPDVVVSAPMAEVLDRAQPRAVHDGDQVTAQTWRINAYANVVATATFVALEDRYARAEFDVAIDDDIRALYQVPDPIRSVLTGDGPPPAPDIEPIQTATTALADGWRNLCRGPCLEDG